MWELARIGLLLGGTALALYRLALRATPGRGWLRLCEKAFCGMITLYLCNLALSLFGAQVAQNPLTVLSAGWLGAPGVAVCAILAGMP